MNPLLQLVPFSSKRGQSYSFLVDLQQLYLRNVVLFCTGLSMVRFLFGEIIICQNTVEENLSQSLIDTKCYINGTTTTRSGKETLYHDYYQWVLVYLLLLACGFYFPYSIWKKLFGRYLEMLESLADTPQEAIRTIRDSNGNGVFVKVWALELVYVGTFVGMLYLTDVFFNRYWSLFGWSWRAIDAIFPDNGKCVFVYHHSSGETHASFNCLLPLCSVYRKIFTLLYGLAVALIPLNSAVFLYRTIVVAWKKKQVNAWWALNVLKERAPSWNARQKINFELKTMGFKRETFSMTLEREKNSV